MHAYHKGCSQGFFNTWLPLQSCGTFICGGACFKQCFSTPSLAKAPSPKTLRPCHSSASCPGSARGPHPTLGFPLKTSWDKLLPGQNPPGAGAGLPLLLGLSGGKAIHLSPSRQIAPVTTQREPAIQAEPWPCIIQTANPAGPGSSAPLPQLALPPRRQLPTAATVAKAKLHPVESRKNFTSPNSPKKLRAQVLPHLHSLPAAPAASWRCLLKYPRKGLSAWLQYWCMGFQGERGQTSRNCSAALIKVCLPSFSPHKEMGVTEPFSGKGRTGRGRREEKEKEWEQSQIAQHVFKEVKSRVRLTNLISSPTLPVNTHVSTQMTGKCKRSGTWWHRWVQEQRWPLGCVWCAQAGWD